jgi:TolB-like protein/Flp pilus assembly protein TadD
MPAGQFDRDSVRRELERVVESPLFVRTERLSRFLRFVVERRLEERQSELKESVIATELFERRPDYDPKLDSIVRTEAARLRARLSEYYAGEGAADPVVIDIPKGGYVPAFRFRETGQAPDILSTRHSYWPRFGTLAILLFILVATAGWWRLAGASEPIPIAVLPLESLGEDSINSDFADGLTDEIIRDLSIIDGLAVRSRTSSLEFKGKPRNVREAGKQLNVDYILEGSVLRAGQKLRINARLVRARDDFPMWSGRFDKELTNIFAIQDEISNGIVNSLRLKLGNGRRRYETSAEAYDLYLQARGGKKFAQRIEGYRQVVSKDPSFAPAYAHLAMDYATHSVQFPVDHPADELEQLQTMAEKAFQLDPLLADAHAALAMFHARHAQWKEAETNFRRAIELDPNNSDTYENYGHWLLMVLGRNEEAIQQFRIENRIDPLAGASDGMLALALIAMRRYDEAESSCPKPSGAGNSCVGRVRLGQGRFDEAVQFLTPFGQPNSNPQNRGFLGYAYARSGRRDLAKKLAANSNYPNEQALIFAGLQDKDRTFSALDRMADLGPQRVGLYLNFPELQILKDDGRLKPFRQKIGLPD